jgi:predicted TIM-barrel fold metal-dependent hydrolase
MLASDSVAPACCAPHDTFAPVGFALPQGACDAHTHIFGPYDQFPLSGERSYTPPENNAARFIWHLDRLGLQRGVLVTASACGVDNRSILDALARYPDRLRGVAVANDQTSADTLASWHDAGIRGLRFNLYALGGKTVYRNGVGLSSLEALAPLLRELGMHAQIWVHAPDLVELGPRFRKLGIPLVVDHMGRMNTALGTDNPGIQALCALLADGIAWTKISGADRNSREKPEYRDTDAFATRLFAANPNHIVWGSDWPHINYYDEADIPDDGVLLNLLQRWLPGDADRHRVLVDNPATLYGFPDP